MEDFWDFLCSTLEILEDKEKKDIIREYGRRIALEIIEMIEKMSGYAEIDPGCKYDLIHRDELLVRIKNKYNLTP